MEARAQHRRVYGRKLWDLGKLALCGVLGLAGVASAQQSEFAVEEIKIRELHKAIQDGTTTCEDVVNAYLERTAAYNGACTALVTADGAPIPQAFGNLRVGKPVEFPTKTVPVGDVLPDLDQYQGPPLELGRMEPLISDPSIQQQFGMRVGIPDAGQLNALEIINLRGERSMSCKAECDAATGDLPAHCPADCDAFRKQPDAIELARQYDQTYGRNPPLDTMPLYCVAFSFKNWYDATEMRATGGNDVAYAMDAPKVDSPDIAKLKGAGAIMFGVATAARTGLDTEGPETPQSYLPDGNYAY